MVYKRYILPIGGLYATYHLLREPKTTIETGVIIGNQPKRCTILRGTPQIYYTFALFDPLKMGNGMTPVKINVERTYLFEKPGSLVAIFSEVLGCKK